MKKLLLLCLSLLSPIALAESNEVEKIKELLDFTKSPRPADVNYLKTYLYRADQQAYTLAEKLELTKKLLDYARANTDKLQSKLTDGGTFLSIIGAMTLAGMFCGTIGGAVAGGNSIAPGLAIGTAVGAFLGILGAAIHATSSLSQTQWAFRNEAVLGKWLSKLELAERQPNPPLIRN